LSHGFGCHFGVRIGAVAARKQTLLTEPALTAADSEWNDDSITDLQVRDFGAKFDNLAHILMPENIPALHGGLIAVKQMKVGTTDRTGGDLDDGIAGVLDFGVGNGVYPNVAFSVPAQCAHSVLLHGSACTHESMSSERNSRRMDTFQNILASVTLGYPHLDPKCCCAKFGTARDVAH